jgi:hypothetical protein
VHLRSVGRTPSLAKSYLRSDAFSYQSLEEQLEYEGFSTSDSIYGASRSGANWMRQAVLMAKSYLRSDAYSRSSLIEQLEYEGFTPAQAVHGVNATGL